MTQNDLKKMNPSFKKRLYETVFEADTAAGKIFDVFLLIAISLSLLTVMMESIDPIYLKYRSSFAIAEWVFTILFTIEYLLRIYAVEKKYRYIFSFYGIIDLSSILPMYLSFIFPVSTYSLAAVRSLRLLRVFRVFKLSRFISESTGIIRALVNSKHKIGVFFFFIILIVIILGTVMYLVEHKENGFTSIPQSIYWAVITLTTVGYGDITPTTDLGKFIASFVMILGYAIIAVPTGIISSELSRSNKPTEITTQTCPKCLKQGHESDAKHCKHCGALMNEP
jgi:voltage-gated potassium channel